MKKLLTGLFAISALIFSANAQTNNSNDQFNNQKRFDRGMMGMQDLNLSDVQKQQMKSINEDFRSKMQALDKMDEITVKEQRGRRQALMQERKDKISGMLTDAQRKQFEEKSMRGGQMNLRGGKMMGNNEDRLLRMKTDLGLSEDQMVRIKKSEEVFSQKARALHEDQSLSQDQKRSQMEQIRKGRKESFESFLTSDQIAKLKQMHHGDWKQKDKTTDGREKIKSKTT